MIHSSDISNIYALYLENSISDDELRLIVHGDGTKMYYLDNNLHRTNGPATIHPDGSYFWFYNNRLHREDGPAYEYADDGTKGYCLHGKCYDGVKTWAKAVLELHNKPNDAKAIDDFLNKMYKKHVNDLI